MTDLATRLGPVELRSPLVAASGTFASAVELEGLADLSVYGAAVAKSVSLEPWPGNPAPRLAPTEAGMLNSVGIQNPGVSEFVAKVGPRLADLDVDVWGSVVGHTAEEFAQVARDLARTGISAIEVNLSCPNLAEGRMFALNPRATDAVLRSVRSAVDLPIGAKLSPNAADIGAVAEAAVEGGADWLVLTNTSWGAAVDVDTRRPLVATGTGGYSGVGLKPLALRCVIEVRRILPSVPIVGCGGIRLGSDVAEYLLAGASAAAIGTAHFEDPRAGKRILHEFEGYCRRQEVPRAEDLVGAADIE